MYESRDGIGRILQFVGSPSFYDDLSLSIGQQYISGSEGESWIRCAVAERDGGIRPFGGPAALPARNPR